MNIARNLLNQYNQDINPLPILRRATGKPVVFTYAGWGEHGYFMSFDISAEPDDMHYDHITVCYDEEAAYVSVYDPYTRKWEDSEGYGGPF